MSPRARLQLILMILIRLIALTITICAQFLLESRYALVGFCVSIGGDIIIMTIILVKYREKNELIRVLGDVNDTHVGNNSYSNYNKHKERPHDTHSTYRDDGSQLYSDHKLYSASL